VGNPIEFLYFNLLKNSLQFKRNWQHRVHKWKNNKTKTQYNMWWIPLLQTNTNNINKTCTLLQTTGGNDDPDKKKILT
jgi:hypothetical protein